MEFQSWNEFLSRKNPTHILALYIRPKGETENTHNSGTIFYLCNTSIYTFCFVYFWHLQIRHVQFCMSVVEMERKKGILNKTGKTRKRVASRKIDTYCTARITATGNLVTGTVHVHYRSSHMIYATNIRLLMGAHAWLNERRVFSCIIRTC